MATVRAYAAVDMRDPGYLYGDYTKLTSTELVLSDELYDLHFVGYGITYSSFGITSGTVTGFGSYYNGQLEVEVYDFNISARTVESYFGAALEPLLSNVLSHSDTIYGSSFDDVLAGYSGNDYFIGKSGTNTIYGGTGRDTAAYSGFGGDYTVAFSGDFLRVTARNGLQVDFLNSVERLDFSNGTLAFDVEGNAGQAYRLYQAAFDRVPDMEGLSYWIDRLDSGTTSLNAIADSFLQSPEFIRTYGTPRTVDNEEFVDLLYTHTLGRNYDLSGFNYWVDRLDDNQTNRGDLLAFFSESDENYNRTIDAIDDGIWIV